MHRIAPECKSCFLARVEVRGAIGLFRIQIRGRNKLSHLFTLRIATIPAEVAAGGVLKLPVAFGADADHV